MLPLGIGLVYAAELLPLFRDAGEIISVVEVEPQTLWRRRDVAGGRIALDPDSMAAIRSLGQHRLAHGVGMPIGGSVTVDFEELRLFVETLDQLHPAWCSEHLSFNRTRSGKQTRMAGFLLPPRQTVEAVAVAARNIAAFSGQHRLPFAFETGVNYLKPVADEMSDGEFFAGVALTADCGILLDLHNLWTNERNGRQSCKEVIACLPPERVWEIHVAGGGELDGFWLDSHAALVPDELLVMLEELLSTLPRVGAVILEVLPEHVRRIGLDAIGRQLELLRSLWDRRELRAAVPSIVPATPVSSKSAVAGDCRSIPTTIGHTENELPSDVRHCVDRVQEWELALVAAIDAAGPPSTNALSSDPGIALYRRLIADFRAAAIAQCLRGTVTLLFLTLGEQRTEDLMRSYLGSSDPRVFAEEEALQFSRFLESRDLALPFLREVLEFESAVLRVAQTRESVIVTFDHDPERLMSSLMEGRFPETVPRPGTRICIQAPQSSCG